MHHQISAIFDFSCITAGSIRRWETTPVLDTQPCRPQGLCGRWIWHKTVGAAVGAARLHVCRGSRGTPGLCASLSKETEEPLSAGPMTHVSVIFTLLLIVFPASLHWKFSLSLSLHLAHFRCTAPSPSLFSGEPAVPCRPVCASAEMTSILSAAGCAVLLLTVSSMRATRRAPLCRRILKTEAAFGVRACRSKS